jgi:hypothetical protein
MPPELQILAINATCLAVGYFGIYPALAQKSLAALGIGDLIVSVVAIGTAGALYWGTGVEFRLLGIPMNWFAFSLTTLIAMGLPLFLWFVRRHGIWPDDEG